MSFNNDVRSDFESRTDSTVVTTNSIVVTLRHSEAFSIPYKIAYGLAPVLFDPCGVFDGGTE